jgi:hypothetical protein
MVGVAVTTVGSTTSAHLRHTNEPEVLAMNLTAAHTAPVAKKPWYRQLYFYVLVAIVLGDGVNADVSSLKPSEDVGTLVQAGEESHWWDFVLRVLPESFVGSFVEGQILQIIFLAVVFGICAERCGPGRGTGAVGCAAADRCRVQGACVPHEGCPARRVRCHGVCDRRVRPGDADQVSGRSSCCSTSPRRCLSWWPSAR